MSTGLSGVAPDVNTVPYTPRKPAVAPRPFFLNHRLAEGVYA